ncbi:MAG: MBL fold metallo-hydrolase, partial [Dysgonomonas sp.]
KAIDFDIKSVAGILLTHSHGDHSKGIKDAISNGMNVYCSLATSDEIGLKGNNRIIEIKDQHLFEIHDYKVYAFEVKHDVKCYGFLINHAESGTICFITDTYYVPYKFNSLNHIIIEANYSNEIVDAKLSDKKFLRDRVLQSHMEIGTTKEFLKANDLKEVSNIILIHLSDSNSDETKFKKEVEILTQKRVTVANKGLKMSLNREPF